MWEGILNVAGTHSMIKQAGFSIDFDLVLSWWWPNHWPSLGFCRFKSGLVAAICLSAGVATVLYLTHVESSRSQRDSLVATSALTLQAEHVLKRVMHADKVADNCGANSTPACCDKSCRAIRYELLHNWEVIVRSFFSCCFLVGWMIGAAPGFLFIVCQMLGNKSRLRRICNGRLKSNKQ